MVALCSQRHKFIDFQLFIPHKHNTAKCLFFIFVAIAIAVFLCAAIKLVVSV